MEPDWKARAAARRKRIKEALAPIREGSFLLCINSQDCKWAVYQAKVPGSDFHCAEREAVFTDEPWRFPDGLGPIRYWDCHYHIESNRYDFNIDAIHLNSIRAVYQSEEEVLRVAEGLRAEEQGYIDATKPFQERFAVFAKLVTADA